MDVRRHPSHFNSGVLGSKNDSCTNTSRLIQNHRSKSLRRFNAFDVDDLDLFLSAVLVYRHVHVEYSIKQFNLALISGHCVSIDMPTILRGQVSRLDGETAHLF